MEQLISGLLPGNQLPCPAISSLWPAISLSCPVINILALLLIDCSTVMLASLTVPPACRGGLAGYLAPPLRRLTGGACFGAAGGPGGLMISSLSLGTCPVAMSTTSLASWLPSRGRFGVGMCSPLGLFGQPALLYFHARTYARTPVPCKRSRIERHRLPLLVTCTRACMFARAMPQRIWTWRPPCDTLHP